jgi:uncharacterized membrane protein YoaK (UPF0700 family)
VLSVTAGSVDVISFLRLGGLFAPHITSNLVILASHVVTGRAAPLSQILSVPMFIAVLALTRLAAAGLEESRHDSLRPLLALRFILLTSFLAICISAGLGLDPSSPTAVVAGMLGVAAMAVQTTDVTTIVMDVGAMLFRRDPNGLARAGSRAKQTWPVVAGFTVGCGLGAVLGAAIGPWSLALPTAFALLAMSLSLKRV